jgi:predicted esterase
MIVDVTLGTGTTGFDVARFARQLDPHLAVIYVRPGLAEKPGTRCPTTNGARRNRKASPH